MNTNKLWIFDVDGTLSNNEHRVRHLSSDQKDWKAFFATQMEDAPYEAVFDLMHSLVELGHKCIIITGRDEEHRQPTFDWVNLHYKYDFKNEDLYMRPRGDRRDDDGIKLEILKGILDKNPEYKVMGIFEDRHRVIDAWRDAGYYVFECNQTRTEF